MEYQYVIIVLVSLLFSALFSGLEVAFVSANRLHLELQSKLGTWNGRILSGLIKRPAQFMGTILIGNTISIVLFGIFITYLLEPFIVDLLSDGIINQGTVFLVQVILATLVILIVAEYIPKSLFRLNPNAMLSFLTIPFLIVYYLVYPIVWVVMGLSKVFVNKVLNLDYSEDKPVFKITDLNSFIQNNLETEGEDAKVDIDTEIFDNAVEFKTIKIRDCMVPRTDIVAVEIDDTIAELKRVFTDSGHSKIIIHRDNIDEVIGYCHQLELLLYRNPLWQMNYWFSLFLKEKA